MKTLDNPLTRHFQSLDDIRYISLKKLFKKTVEELTVANNCIKQFLLCEQASDVLEYLIVFCKNIIRMGFSEVFPGVEEELATLYDAEENVNRILAEAVASIRSESIDLGSRTLFIDKFENASDDEESTLALEKYQSLINTFLDGNTDPYVVLKNLVSGTKRDKALEEKLKEWLKNTEYNFQRLFLYIKEYQFKQAINMGFESPLDYIERKYTVNRAAVKVMEQSFLSIKKDYTDTMSSIDDGFSEHLTYAVILSQPLSFEEAMALLQECFGTISEAFGNMIKQACEEKWIDWENRRNKLHGYYTNTIHYNGKSLICLEYNGTLECFCKLAHELGHAYHGWLLQSKSYFEYDFSVITAETFGLFCERYAYLFLVKKGLVNETVIGDAFKKWVSDIYRSISTNYLSFSFEKSIFSSLAHKKSVSVSGQFADCQNKICITPINELSCYEWIFRSQNFFPDYYYYNFVYVLGEVVSLSLIDRLINAQLQFCDIEQMLKNSGIYPVHDLFEQVGIDLDNPLTFQVNRMVLDIRQNMM